MEKYSKCITITLIKVVNNVLLKSNLLIASLLIQKKKLLFVVRMYKRLRTRAILKTNQVFPVFIHN